MKIIEKDGRISLIAEDQMAICPKATHDPVVESVSLSPTDSPDNWMDCQKCEDEPTMADKDAALRRFGVEV